MNRAWGTAVVALASLTLAGCSSPTTSPAASTPARPTAFLTFAHAASFGTKDLQAATDKQVLDFGNIDWRGLDAGGLLGQVVQMYVEAGVNASQAEAEAFTREAVTNLCPKYASMVPE